MRIACLFGLVLASVLLMGFASAELSCSITSPGSCSGTILVYLSAATNAHLSQNSAPGFTDYAICCSEETGLLGTSCSESPSAVFLKLSDQTNAHAESFEQSNYPESLCISLDGGEEVSCKAEETASCTNEYECIVALSAWTNSHAFACSSSVQKKICCRVVANLNTYIDQIGPVSGIIQPWTTTSSFTVGWKAEQSGAVDNFDVQYRVPTVIPPVGWTDWHLSTSSNSDTFGPSAPYLVMDGHTYVFRVRGRMGSAVGEWSEEESTTIDQTPPTCTITPLPEYTESVVISLEWSGDDETSGISDYDIRQKIVNPSGGETPWTMIPDLEGTELTNWDFMNRLEGYNYSFQCRARDNAGNEGEWSDVEFTTIDTEYPYSELKPIGAWINDRIIDPGMKLEWDGTDHGGSGVKCYDVQYSINSDPMGDWYFINFEEPEPTPTQTTCFTPPGPVNPRTLRGWVTFNESTTIFDSDGDETFYFRIGSEDNLGNVEPHHYAKLMTSPGYWNVTTDFGIPATYADSEIVSGGFEEPTYDVVLKANSSDTLSGIDTNIIHFELMMEGGENEVYTVPCGSTEPRSPQNYSVCETDPITITEMTDLLYYVVSTDRAGNQNQTETRFETKHKLANFLSHNIYLTIGQSRIIKVRVKNVQDVEDTVTVNIGAPGTTYPPSYYKFIEADEYLKEGGGNKVIEVTLGPLEYMDFFVRVDSIYDTEHSPFTIKLEATSLQYLPGDRDTAFITIQYPAGFPGMGTCSIIILVCLATLIFFWKGEHSIRKRA